MIYDFSYVVLDTCLCEVLMLTEYVKLVAGVRTYTDWLLIKYASKVRATKLIYNMNAQNPEHTVGILAFELR